MKDKAELLLYFILWTMIAGFLVHGAMAFYFYRFYQTPSVTWGEEQFKMVNKVIVSGDPIEFIINERCSKDTYSAKINREIADALTYTLTLSEPIFPKGCHPDVRTIPGVSQLVPANHVYYMKNNIEVTVRWLYFSRVDKYQTRTEDFTIIPKGQQTVVL